MALVKSNFIPASAMANSNAGRLFSYRTTDDAIAAVKAKSYFDEVADFVGGGLHSGDFILVDATNGQSYLFVGVAPATGVVTVESALDFV